MWAIVGGGPVGFLWRRLKRTTAAREFQPKEPGGEPPATAGEPPSDQDQRRLNGWLHARLSLG
ncbi:hypothetical protein GCM10009712_11430 [Pseudarthrobacter sulfonivorans]